MTANRIEKRSVFRLPSVTVLASAYITHHGNSQDILHVKADNGNDTCQKAKNESTSTNDEEIKSDECNTAITWSEKCDFCDIHASYLGNTKCS